MLKFLRQLETAVLQTLIGFGIMAAFIAVCVGIWAAAIILSWAGKEIWRLFALG